MIEEKVLEYGGGFTTVKRSIEFNNGHDENTLTVDYQNRKIVGASYKFGGVQSFGGGQSKLEELARFKQLLNSFPDL